MRLMRWMVLMVIGVALVGLTSCFGCSPVREQHDQDGLAPTQEGGCGSCCKEGESVPSGKEQEESKEAKDPVCGMKVTKDEAKTYEYEKKVKVAGKTVYVCPMGCVEPQEKPGNCSKCGMELKAKKTGGGEKTLKKTFYFCSDKCLEKFKKKPSGYVTGMPGEKCVCTKGMPNCKCGHCKDRNEMCECDKEKQKDEHKHDEGNEGHHH